MAFFYVSMAFSVTMTPKHAKQGILHFYIIFIYCNQYTLQGTQKIPMFIVEKIIN